MSGRLTRRCGRPLTWLPVSALWALLLLRTLFALRTRSLLLLRTRSLLLLTVVVLSLLLGALSLLLTLLLVLLLTLLLRFAALLLVLLRTRPASFAALRTVVGTLPLLTTLLSAFFRLATLGLSALCLTRWSCLLSVAAAG